MGFRAVILATLLLVGCATATTVRIHADELDRYSNGERHYFPQQFDEDRFLESPSSSSSDSESSSSGSSSSSSSGSSSSSSSGSSSSGSSSSGSSSSGSSSGSSGSSSGSSDSSGSSNNPPPIPPSSRSGSSSSSSSSESSDESSSSGSSMDDELIKNMHMVAKDDDSNKDQELAEALQNVKDQIVFKANEIKREKRWVREVTKIIEAYIKKSRRVNANIRKLQDEVKVLFRKKKQIENMIVQRKLEKKLTVANKDLGTIKAALKSVKAKETAFKKSQTDIKQTIGAMETELAKLRGVPGESSSGSSSSSSESS